VLRAAKRLLLKVHLRFLDCLHRGLQDLSQFDLRCKLLDIVNWLRLLVCYHFHTAKLPYLHENLRQPSMHLHLYEDLLWDRLRHLVLVNSNVLLRVNLMGKAFLSRLQIMDLVLSRRLGLLLNNNQALMVSLKEYSSNNVQVLLNLLHLLIKVGLRHQAALEEPPEQRLEVLLLRKL
jgi:hypothetical protein